MPRYLISFDDGSMDLIPAEDLPAVGEATHAVVQEAKDAGVWVFGGGLHPPATATTLRPKDDEILVTDGPFIEGPEHVGGFSVIEAPDLDAALEWGRKLVRATTLPIEVRPFYDGAH